jgi:hypothetical protein
MPENFMPHVARDYNVVISIFRYIDTRFINIILIYF